MFFVWYSLYEMHPRVILFIGNFFFSMCTALTIYVALPFLTASIPTTAAGLVIAGGGLIAVISFPFLPRLVARYGAQELALLCGTVQMIALLALAIAPGVIAGSLLIILTLALQPFISYELDLLLEATTTPTDGMGRVRTTFLTAWNLGVLSAPLLLGALLLDSNAYGRIFLAAAGMMIPFIILFAASSLPRGVGPKLSHMQDTLVCIAHDRDLSSVTFAHFLLYLFYIWAPFYTPIYLHTVLGISWASLGWMFSVMLLPYVLIEYPAGWVADRILGDKKLMLLGFILAGGAFASLSLLTPTSSLGLILGILVTSRIGTALIESMTETHFFRRVSAQDINSVSFFRSVWPLAYSVGPVIGSLILLMGSYSLFFLITGSFILLAGMVATSRIKDGLQ